MALARFILIVCLMAISLLEIHGHGMLLVPVSRSSAWRFGFPVEPNYNDNELYCGGMNVQFEQNHGKCGECGDDFALPRPRPNENGGVYGTGVIVKKYIYKSIIDAKVRLTANHGGTFSFHLCPLDKHTDLETEECFNRYPLMLADGGYQVQVPSTKMEYDVKVRLPEGLVCEHCVFRWTYRAGNNWGKCDNGISALGCGPQETFKNCADIAIAY